MAKVTLTSPSLYANLWSPTHSRDAYPTLDGFLEDVAAITRDEIAELARLGCTYIQLDAPHYPLLIESAPARSTSRRGGRPSAGSTAGSSSTTG